MEKLQLVIRDLTNEVNRIKESLECRAIDKSFETSYTRLIVIMIMTYVLIYFYMRYILEGKNSELNALVPTLGFNLSNLSLSWMKRIWQWCKHHQYI